MNNNYKKRGKFLDFLSAENIFSYLQDRQPHKYVSFRSTEKRKLIYNTQ